MLGKNLFEGYVYVKKDVCGAMFQAIIMISHYNEVINQYAIVILL